MEMKREMAKLATILWVLVVLGGLPAQADMTSIKLTSDALGLGSSDINSGKEVDPDVPGKLITSSTVGEGSKLTIQESGLAGPGTGIDRLLVTLTAQTHLDTLYYPWVGGDPRDYQAGILKITKESSEMPNGRKEGVGVRAFQVDKDAYRIYDAEGSALLADIKGSGHVSGGTGPDTFDPLNPNGAPHVDEAVKFDFDSFWLVDAHSVEVLLSDYDPSDIIDLDIELTSGSMFDFDFLQTTDTSIFEKVDSSYDKLWRLKFSGLSGLGATDLIDNFTIYANDDDPLNPSGTAEHFYITGMTADVEPVPAPSAVVLGSLGLGFSGWLLRKRRIL